MSETDKLRTRKPKHHPQTTCTNVNGSRYCMCLTLDIKEMGTPAKVFYFDNVLVCYYININTCVTCLSI